MPKSSKHQRARKTLQRNTHAPNLLIAVTTVHDFIWHQTKFMLKAPKFNPSDIDCAQLEIQMYEDNCGFQEFVQLAECFGRCLVTLCREKNTYYSISDSFRIMCINYNNTQSQSLSIEHFFRMASLVSAELASHNNWSLRTRQLDELQLIAELEATMDKFVVLLAAELLTDIENCRGFSRSLSRSLSRRRKERGRKVKPY